MNEKFDDVWFTCKSRIAAELRLKNNDTHSQLLLVWYAVFSLGIAIYELRNDDFLGPQTDIYSAILSLALLVLSMVVSLRDFRGRAALMRANHIDLKLLYDGLVNGSVPENEKSKKYYELLKNCENHLSYDYRYFRFFNPSSSPVNKREGAVLIAQAILRWAFIAILYVLPAVILLLNFECLHAATTL